MALDSMQDLFLNELKDVLNAEKQIITALPRMAKAASSPELEQAFTKHLRETEGQVTRLEQVFRTVGEKPRGKKCDGIMGIVEEGRQLVKRTNKTTTTKPAQKAPSACPDEHRGTPA